LDANNINKEISMSVWGPLRHSKPSAWAEHPSAIKLVGVLHLGVSEWKPRLWYYWGPNSFSTKCQWATPLHVRLSEVWGLRTWISATKEIWLSKMFNSVYGVSLNMNFGQ